ncbi:DUF922 domain-containing Zn-dependent protease [Uliginosibacterium gangwonense]|uniref:DUF922 domain-containing Zn-dependent protease n=1 Tax=Uliginosibacterium gangwonense TaxID=392736 RepID=UPI000374F286|nr:DUF922 domain-containing protein [Uliginosibacterium gangwonense]
MFSLTGLRLGAAVGLLSLVACAQAAVRDEVSYQFYDLSLRTGESVYQALSRSSPIRSEGKVFFGYTTWNVHWNYRWWREGDGQCRITENTVLVSSIIQLPQLRGDLGRLQERYERAFAALKLHEQGHVDIGRSVAKEIDHFILSLPEKASCAQLEQAANTGARDILAHSKGQDRDYDARTGHGKTQGAWFDF